MRVALHALGAGMVVAALVVAVALPHRPTRHIALSRRTDPRTLGLFDRATCVLCLWLHVPVPDEPGRRRLRCIAGLVALAVVVAPPLTVPIVAIAWLRARHEALRLRRGQERAVAVALPDAVDLLLLSISAGHSLSIAHPLVATRVPPPLGTALHDAAIEADRGRSRAEAIVDAMTPLGGRAVGLGHTLADHLRYGVPLAPTLDRLGSELRLDRRRRAEQEARRVPVRLLAPLVACVLPAFALLTVVPLLAASLRALPT